MLRRLPGGRFHSQPGRVATMPSGRVAWKLKSGNNGFVVNPKQEKRKSQILRSQAGSVSLLRVLQTSAFTEVDGHTHRRQVSEPDNSSV